MFRYLLNISYLGTPFRGAQRQVSVAEGRLNDPTTIQGQLEMALKVLHPIKEPAFNVASRTDTGVHAIHSTGHVDLEFYTGDPIDPVVITSCVNRYFTKGGVPIRILKTYLVPNSFHSRANAISRTYLYRLCVIESPEVSSLHQHFPLQEIDRCTFVSADTFDIEAARYTATLFEGYHDFRSFAHKSKIPKYRITRKCIEKLEIQESKPFCTEPFGWPTCSSNDKSNYAFYDIVIKGNGFLQRQVRRTVAALIAVAKGRVTPRDIKFMLEIPSHHSWNNKLQTAPAQGLYLCEVAYSQDDLDTFKEKLEI